MGFFPLLGYYFAGKLWLLWVMILLLLVSTLDYYSARYWLHPFEFVSGHWPWAKLVALLQELLVSSLVARVGVSRCPCSHYVFTDTSMLPTALLSTPLLLRYLIALTPSFDSPSV